MLKLSKMKPRRQVASNDCGIFVNIYHLEINQLFNRINFKMSPANNNDVL